MTVEPLDEVRTLIEALCEDGLSSEEHDRLQSLLENSNSAQWLYLDYLNLHANLSWDACHLATLLNSSPPAKDLSVANSATEPGSTFVPPASPVLGFLGRSFATLNRPVFWSIGGVGVLFCCYALVLLWNLRSGSLRSDGHDIAVAVLSDAEGVEWSKDIEPKTSNAPIHEGEPLRIDSGILQLELNQGATLVVEGPAEWTIDGDNTATLNRGKLMASVPRQAIGFTLKTPSARIVDLGTEFGVEVGDGGAAEVHVVQGKVDVQPASGSSQAGPGTLQAGQSVRITDAGAKVESSSAVPGKFKRLAGTASRNASKSKDGRISSVTRLIDLSQGAVASQSSEFDKARYPAEKAIDGNPGTFTHTDGSDVSPWWQIDLGGSHKIAAVVLQNRRDSLKARLRDITVKVLAEDGVTVVAESSVLNPRNGAWGGLKDANAGPAELAFDLIKAKGQPAVGRYVRVERTPDEHDDYTSQAGLQAYVTLAEVQVFETSVSAPAVILRPSLE